MSRTHTPASSFYLQGDHLILVSGNKIAKVPERTCRLDERPYRVTQQTQTTKTGCSGVLGLLGYGAKKRLTQPTWALYFRGKGGAILLFPATFVLARAASSSYWLKFVEAWRRLTNYDFGCVDK